MLGRLTNFTGVGEWRLNGKLLPPIWAQPYETDLGTICRDGRNTLEVVQYTTPHRKFPDSPFDREYKPEVIQVPEFILCL